MAEWMSGLYAPEPMGSPFELESWEFRYHFGSIISILCPAMVVEESFTAYLLDPNRCTDKRFRVVPLMDHALIAWRCLSAVEIAVQEPGIFDDWEAKRDTYEYARVSWALHLQTAVKLGWNPLLEKAKLVGRALLRLVSGRLLRWTTEIVKLDRLDEQMQAIRSICDALDIEVCESASSYEIHPLTSGFRVSKSLSESPESTYFTF